MASQERNRILEKFDVVKPELTHMAMGYASAFRACHPVGSVGMVAALYYNDKTSKAKYITTEGASEILGKHNLKNSHIYNFLEFRWGRENNWDGSNESGPIIAKGGMEGIYQTWYLPEKTNNIKLPELSMLIVNWIDENSGALDPFRLIDHREAGEANEDLFFVKAVYLLSLFLDNNEISYSELIDDFLAVQKGSVDLVVKEMSRSRRESFRTSLIKSKLLKRTGNIGKFKHELTDQGISFVKDVVIPFSALLTDEDSFMVKPEFEKYRKVLMLTMKDYAEDRNNARMLLERFGKKIAQRYASK